MLRTVTVLAAVVLASAACETSAQPTAGRTKEQPKMAVGAGSSTVDANWLERAVRHDSESDATPLVKEFAKAHPSAFLPSDARLDDAAPYLNVTTANLDEDRETEHLVLIGSDEAHTMLYVIDRRGGQQEIIFTESVDMFNEAPELHVIDQGQNKLFYLRVLHDRGSGVWLFTYRFYKMLQGTVHEVLEIVQESNLMLEPSDLYQNAQAKVQPVQEGILVKYTYAFSPSMRLLIDLGLAKDYSEEKEVALVSGEENVLYAWDDASKKLVPRLRGSGLSESKIRCFTKLGEEKLFASAFEGELRGIARSGTAEQKKVAMYLLKKIGGGQSPGRLRN